MADSSWKIWGHDGHAAQHADGLVRIVEPRLGDTIEPRLSKLRLLQDKFEAPTEADP